MNCGTKHLLHCASLWIWIGIVIYFTLSFDTATQTSQKKERYGFFFSALFLIWKCTSLLILPQFVFQVIGLTCFNPFREKVPLKSVPILAPFVCFRVVTRGNYPKLVKDNLNRNIDVCRQVGMMNFMFEVVTDTRINLPAAPLVREVVVPDSYTTKSGALFKARALQYCIEEDVNRLRDSDWVVHLDEETLLTNNSVCGILNFVESGKHDFGQGLITYANGQIVNLLNTLSDSYRVADDCGKLHAQLSVLHRPIFGWKGSYVVTRFGAERTITWDHGPEGSIAEDTYFAILAMQAGYSFEFIDGEMLEQSPFTSLDFLQQRKRWLEGLMLTVHSKEIRLIHKIPLAMTVYSWLISPLMISQLFFMPFFQAPKNVYLESINAAILAINIYMLVFGVVMSFTKKYRTNVIQMLLYCIGGCLTIPYTVVIQAASVFLLIFGAKKEFYIVKKETRTEYDIIDV